MSYEDYRAKLVSRLVDKLPIHLLTEVMRDQCFLWLDCEKERMCF